MRQLQAGIRVRTHDSVGTQQGAEVLGDVKPEMVVGRKICNYKPAVFAQSAHFHRRLQRPDAMLVLPDAQQSVQIQRINRVRSYFLACRQIRCQL
jgi:hypothetical protein